MNLYFFKTFNEKFGIKIFAIFAIFIFFVSSSFTVFFIHSQRKLLKDKLIMNGKLLAGILAYNSRLGVFSENEELLKDSVEGIFRQKGILEVSVFNLEGELLKKQERHGIRPPIGSDESVKGDEGSINKLFEKLMAPGSSFYLEGTDKFEFWSPVISGVGYSKEESLYLEDDPLHREERVIGFVGITVDKKMHNKRLKTLLFKGIMIGIIFLIMGSVIIYLVIKGMTKPLNRLTEGVKALGMGGVVDKIPVETKDQIGKLAKAFNNMSESLKRREAEKQQLEEQLRHSQKMEAIGTLAGGIAHDFNNILGSILLNTEMAFDDAPENSEARYSLEQVLKGIHRAKQLIEQILTFSRGAGGKRKLLKIDVIVKETLKMLRAMIPSTIEIRQDVHTDVGTVVADPTQIQQLVMNLCSNAAHAMNANGGILKVKLMDIDLHEPPSGSNLCPGSYVKLTISDTGYGISPEIKERIFDPFFTTKKPGEGTGLGLSVVHGIVVNHDGTITVDSKPGKETTFQIFFPRVDGIVTSKQEKARPLPMGNERILLVDDEEPIVDAGRRILERLGYKLTVATSSIEALELFRANADHFDLVIADYAMPQMRGTDLAKKILRIRADITVILFTGSSESITPERIESTGIRELITKPVNRRQMAECVRRLLDEAKGVER